MNQGLSILGTRCGITPELTGCERTAFYQTAGFNDESIAIEQSGSMSCWAAHYWNYAM
jgi:hypothetical protein